MEYVYFNEVSGDASWPPYYPNQPKKNQNGLGLNPGILVTVEEDLVGYQGHHNTQHLEGSGDVEAPGVISDDGPGTTSRKSPIFQVHNLFLQVLRLPVFLSLPFFLGDLPGLLQNH